MRKLTSNVLVWLGLLFVSCSAISQEDFKSLALSAERLQQLSGIAENGDYEGAVILTKIMRSVVDKDGFESYSMYVAIKILDE